jgi:hypothetical protein
MTFSQTQINTIVSYMDSKIGHPYSEGLNVRLGPTFFDCSGLVYEAMHAAGINIPRSDAIAASEANWLGSNGAQQIKDVSQVQKGDIVFFTGAAPGASNYGPIGHVGVAQGNGQYVSAYDTALGVTTTKLTGDHFVIGMRLNNKGASPGNTPAPAGGGGGGILSIPSEITNFFTDANKFITLLMWLAQPSSWLRIGAFVVGVGLLLFAIHALIAAANGTPLVKMPSVIPVPV